jgi:YD repeat-containing protein
MLESYSSSGQLLSIRYPNGLSHSLSYGTDTITITRKNDSLALGLTGDNVTSVTLPDGSVINYTYDTAGGFERLRTVTYADNTTRTYAYDNASFPSYITSIQDANGNTISTVQYDSEGRAISSEMGELNSGIERSQIEYHEDGRRTVTNALGKKNTYHFTQFNGEYKMTQVEGLASENCASANQAYTYDTNGFMASKTDWKGNVTSYIHNGRGLETSRTEASGTPEARTITTEWHATFNLRTKVTEPERETVFIYDPNGRLLSRQVQPRSN